MTPVPGAAPRRVLVVGSGGREHTLAWRIAGEAGVEGVIVAPGNPGMRDVASVRPAAAASDVERLADLCVREEVDLVVIGPEAPLVAGVADALAGRGVAVFGPRAAAAALEGSKAFCRSVAEAAGVAMADGVACDDPTDAIRAVRRLGGRVVVKADGLAAGKGVTVCDSPELAEAAIRAAMVTGVFGSAGRRVVVERALEGREASVIAICDATGALALPAARDHKRIFDGDRGPNTGGMGAYSPVEDLADDEVCAILERVHLPVLAELARRGTPFRGALYAGLMLTSDGPRLLEFNVRFGDPETQAILPRLDVPLGALLAAAAHDRLAETAEELGIRGSLLPVRPEAAVAVVLAAAGYPGTPRLGAPIEGIEAARASGALVFCAGVAEGAVAPHGSDEQRAAGGQPAAGDPPLGGEGALITAGGRVLAVVGIGGDVSTASASAYAAADHIRFEGRQLRRDIGTAVGADRGSTPPPDKSPNAVPAARFA